MSIAPGARLGPYDVTAPLGAGGMGEVYRARDSRLHRDVAIKVLPPAFATDPNRMARFAREAQVLASLSHPNIAAIYGLEDSGGASALVMELVEGATLSERIAAGPIPVDEALAIARQIADALEAAHDKGIIHRDLKPANIKITPEGKVKVLDFGLAKAMDADPVSGNPANSPTLTIESTRMGQIMGTAAYMSPEQARGKTVDKRADIWAFGVVLYEMLSGQSVFEGETVSDTLAAVLRADLDWKRLPSATPPKVRRLLLRCLERDPKRRLRDIGDAWIEMETPDEPAPIAAPPPRASAALRWLPWIAAAVLGGAGVTWGLLHGGPTPARPVARWTSSQKGFQGFVNISHDGTRLVYTEGSLNNLRLGLRMLDQFAGKPIEGTEGGFFPVFSPDGQWILYSTPQNKIKKIPVTGGTSITLCDGNTTLGADWGEDDNIVFAGSKGLMRVPASGGAPETLTTIDAKKGEAAHLYPQVLPGARKILFTLAMGPGSDLAKAALFDAKTRSYSAIASAGNVTRYAPTGHLLYLRGGTLFALPFDLKRMTPTGSEAPVIEGVSSVGPTRYADYSFSDAGLLLYIVGSSGAQQGTTLAWSDRNGVVQPITTTAQLWGTGRLSPDGARIANGLSKGGGDRDVWVYDIARGTSTRLSFEGSSDDAIWFPDGRRIAFGYGREGKTGVYTVPADGSGKPELLLATERRPVPNSFTPDGKTLVFTMPGSDSKPRIMVFTAGSQARPLHDTSFAETSAQLSPDGKWLAYESTESGSQEVYVQPFPGPGAKVRISIQGGGWPRWARNQRELFFWEGTSPTTHLLSAEVQTGSAFRAGPPRLVLSVATGTTWDVAPDGKRFLVEMTPLGDNGMSRVAAVTDWFEELRRRAPAKK